MKMHKMINQSIMDLRKIMMRFFSGLSIPLFSTLLFSYSAFAVDHLQIKSVDAQPVIVTDVVKPLPPPTQAPCVCKNDIFSYLHLTDKQLGKIKSIQIQSYAMIAAKHSQLVSVRNRIELVIRQNSVDEAALDKLINEKKEILATIMKHRALVKHEIYALLSDAQRVQYDKDVHTLDDQQFDNLAIGKSS